MKAREKIWKMIKTKILGGEGPVPPFSVENPCSFSEKCDKIPHGRIFCPLQKGG